MRLRPRTPPRRRPTLRLGLGGHVHRIARGLDSREQPRHGCSHAEERDRAGTTLTRGLDPLGNLAEQGQPARGSFRRPSRPDEPPRRFGRTRPARTCIRRRSTGGRPMLSADAVSRSRCASSRNGRPPYTLRVSKAARPRSSASSSARMTASSGSTSPRPDAASARGSRGRHRLGHSGPDRFEQRTRLRPGLLELGRRIGVPDDTASHPEMDRPVGHGEREW